MIIDRKEGGESLQGGKHTAPVVTPRGQPLLLCPCLSRHLDVNREREADREYWPHLLGHYKKATGGRGSTSSGGEHRGAIDIYSSLFSGRIEEDD